MVQSLSIVAPDKPWEQRTAKERLLLPLREQRKVGLAVFHALDQIGVLTRPKNQAELAAVRAMLAGDILLRIARVGSEYLLAFASLEKNAEAVEALANAWFVVWWYDEEGDLRPCVLRGMPSTDRLQTWAADVRRCHLPRSYDLLQFYVRATAEEVVVSPEEAVHESRVAGSPKPNLVMRGIQEICLHAPTMDGEKLFNPHGGLRGTRPEELFIDGQLRMVSWRVDAAQAGQSELTQDTYQ